MRLVEDKAHQETTAGLCQAKDGGCEATGLQKAIYGLSDSPTSLSVWGHSPEFDGRTWCGLIVVLSLVLGLWLAYALRGASKLGWRRTQFGRWFRRVGPQIQRNWDFLGRCVLKRIQIWRHDPIVQLQQTDFHEFGQTLRQLKNSLAPSVYNTDHAIQFKKRYWSALGRLLQRHVWAIDKRRRRALQNLAPGTASPLSEIRWYLGNGQLASR
jgi:hypothetical protein